MIVLTHDAAALRQYRELLRGRASESFDEMVERAYRWSLAALPYERRHYIGQPVLYAPPTLSSYTESASFVTATSRNITISWLAGQVIVIAGITENEGTVTLTNPPTAAGGVLTFVNATGSPSTNGTNQWPGFYFWSARAAADGASVVITSATGSGKLAGIAAFVLSGCDGLGTMVQTKFSGTTTAPTVALTRAQANSMVLAAQGDFNAINDTTVTANAGNGAAATQRHAQNTATGATIFLFSYPDQGAAGTAGNSYGITGGGSSAAGWACVAIEMKGTQVKLAPRMMQAMNRAAVI